MRHLLISAVLLLTACPPHDTETDTDPGTDTDTGALPAPTNLVATPGSGQIQLNWNQPPGGVGYIVQRSDLSGGPYTEIGRAAVLRFTDTGLTDGDTWYYVVIAANADGESLPSDEATATAGE